jgi:NTP pyrophosphatase (non-canonical NTP hydrolase)
MNNVLNDKALEIDKLARTLSKWLHEPTTMAIHYGYLESEIKELKEALESGNVKEIYDELGDVIYNVLRIGALTGLDLEDALENTYMKVSDRMHATVGSTSNKEGWARYDEYKATEKKDVEPMALEVLKEPEYKVGDAILAHDPQHEGMCHLMIYAHDNLKNVAVVGPCFQVVALGTRDMCKRVHAEKYDWTKLVELTGEDN